jgi:hypothetical protein
MGPCPACGWPATNAPALAAAKTTEAFAHG